MADAYKYVVIGAGLAGASAVEGIREVDKAGSVLLIGAEKHLPYNRPPLSKKLWFGQKKVEDIFVHDAEFYVESKVDVTLETDVVGLDARAKNVTDAEGNAHSYEKLLLATGGAPKRLDIPGAELDGVCYYRTLDDYFKVSNDAVEAESAVVIGGGFIGSEMAAALHTNKINVTMVFPEPYLVSRVFPEGLGRDLSRRYEDRGIRILAGDVPSAIEKNHDAFVTRTREGKTVESDLAVVGIGIAPSTKLAQAAGLQLDNGIVVNEFLQTSDPDIYAAGDNAFFPYQALGGRRRVEHWDHALNSGKHAGRNMAGAGEPYVYMPYFFSDLFEFGYEAVGDIDPRLHVVEDWQKQYDTGVIYYLQDSRVRGAMMCNVWDRVPAARELIRSGERMTVGKLQGAIR